MKCPDCGAEIHEVSVERYQTKTFKVDHGKKELTPFVPNSDWEDSADFVYRCPMCDSLNNNGLLSKYILKEE